MERKASVFLLLCPSKWQVIKGPGFTTSRFTHVRALARLKAAVPDPTGDGNPEDTSALRGRK